MILKRWGLSTGLLILFGVGGCQHFSLKTANNRDLAIIYNQGDPLSRQIAEYYQKQRQIPRQNLIKVNFNPQQTVLPPEVFEKIQAEVDAKTPQSVQGYVLTWAKPYRVGCMSITSAFALGFDPAYCASSCSATKANPFFNQKSSQPYTDYGIRPTMMLAATNFKEAKALIDRGVAADGTAPDGTAYLMETTDQSRNVRAVFYPEIKEKLGTRIQVKVIAKDSLEKQSDVLFYFTGLPQVKNLTTLRFRPGAIADHLTSFGGQLTDSSQMSSLRWLEAGATGSYGTVVEPCNFPQKFPHPGIVMSYYLKGDTLLNAYWKSVLWPGQGLFIGEPLARPYGRRLDKNRSLREID